MNETHCIIISFLTIVYIVLCVGIPLKIMFCLKLSKYILKKIIYTSFQVIKDNCNPVYDENFEYLISQAELNGKQLEVSVVTQKKLFTSGSNVMGQVCKIIILFTRSKFMIINFGIFSGYN